MNRGPSGPMIKSADQRDATSPARARDAGHGSRLAGPGRVCGWPARRLIAIRLARVERDQIPAGEHRLDHGQPGRPPGIWTTNLAPERAEPLVVRQRPTQPRPASPAREPPPNAVPDRHFTNSGTRPARVAASNLGRGGRHHRGRLRHPARASVRNATHCPGPPGPAGRSRQTRWPPPRAPRNWSGPRQTANCSAPEAARGPRQASATSGRPPGQPDAIAAEGRTSGNRSHVPVIGTGQPAEIRLQRSRPGPARSRTAVGQPPGLRS